MARSGQHLPASGIGSLMAYWRFYRAVAAAQLAGWLAPPSAAAASCSWTCRDRTCHVPLRPLPRGTRSCTSCLPIPAGGRGTRPCGPDYRPRRGRLNGGARPQCDGRRAAKARPIAAHPRRPRPGRHRARRPWRRCRSSTTIRSTASSPMTARSPGICSPSRRSRRPPACSSQAAGSWLFRFARARHGDPGGAASLGRADRPAKRGSSARAVA